MSETICVCGHEHRDSTGTRCLVCKHEGCDCDRYQPPPVDQAEGCQYDHNAISEELGVLRQQNQEDGYTIARLRAELAEATKLVERYKGDDLCKPTVVQIIGLGIDGDTPIYLLKKPQTRVLRNGYGHGSRTTIRAAL